MRNILRTLGVITVAGFVWLNVGCEWEAADSWNTSQGAGVNWNFSGVYVPTSGSYITGTNITRLVITQIGNTLEVRDNDNLTYSGTVGSPAVSQPMGADGTYAAGAYLMESQVNFESDGDNPQTTHDDVQFTGILRMVAVSDITATTTTLTIDEDELQQTTTRTYSITEANARYILEGNWVINSARADGGQTVQSFSAWAPAGTGDFTPGGLTTTE